MKESPKKELKTAEPEVEKVRSQSSYFNVYTYMLYSRQFNNFQNFS